jgi:hypothetical protein
MDLVNAARIGDVVTIRTLVAQGVDVEAVDDVGDRPVGGARGGGEEVSGAEGGHRG